MSSEIAKPALQAALGRDSFVAEFKASAAQIEERNEITVLRRSLTSLVSYSTSEMFTVYGVTNPASTSR